MNRFTLFYGTLLLLLFSPSQIFSDLITLTNGETIEGIFIKGNDLEITIDTLKEIKTIPRIEITNISLGYPGIFGCFQLYDEKVPRCQALVHKFSDKSLLVGLGKGFLDLESIPYSEIKTVTVRKKTNSQKMVPILKLGHTYFLQTNKGNFTGKLIEKGSETIAILEDSTKIVLKDESINSVTWNNTYNFEWSDLSALLPGYDQIRAGRYWVGIPLALLSVGSIAGSISEYSKAQSTKDGPIQFLPIGNQVYLGYNLYGKNEAQTHVSNSNALGGAFALLYLVHGIDLYFQKTSPIALRVKPIPQNQFFSGTIGPYALGTSIGAEISFEFQF